MSTIVVTRHPELVDYLYQREIISGACSIMEHATEDDIRGYDVVGVLPLHLAAVANSVTVVPLNVPQEKRGDNLTKEEIRQYAGEPRTFKVEEITNGK